MTTIETKLKIEVSRETVKKYWKALWDYTGFVPEIHEDAYKMIGNALSTVFPYDFEAHLTRQYEFSLKTFGPGKRTEGVTDHIERELKEIRDNPNDADEWVDVVILGFDGGLRAGLSPSEFIAKIVAKQAKNERRDWPDWRTADQNKAIEHIRGKED